VGVKPFLPLKSKSIVSVQYLHRYVQKSMQITPYTKDLKTSLVLRSFVVFL